MFSGQAENYLGRAGLMGKAGVQQLVSRAKPVCNS
jgi:hypothetical protein